MGAVLRVRELVRHGAGAALLAIILLLVGPPPGLSATPEPSPLQPVDTSSPRATLQEFQDNMAEAYHDWRAREIAPGLRSLTRGLRTLDLSGHGDALAQDIGGVAGLYLLETLNRIELPPPDAIPDVATVQAQDLTRWTIPGTDITIGRVAEGDRAGEFLFTPDTVARAQEFYEQVKSLPVLRGEPGMVETWKDAPGLLMPNALAALVWQLPNWAFAELFNQPLWKWLAAFGVTGLAAWLIYLLWRAGRAWDRRRTSLDQGWAFGQPAAALVAIAVLVGLEFVLKLVIQFRGEAGLPLFAAIAAVRYLVLAWLVAVLATAVGRVLRRTWTSNGGGLDAALIRLCFRILSFAGALLVLLHAASEFGVSITPIIAGLGVGGLAVALAIRPTLENIVGGFILFADKPVRVGEDCRFGDQIGTVEAIGLRSTRIRTLDRTLVTVPNADFAQMQIGNFSRRDKNLYRCQIGLRYETTPDQLRFVAAEIRKLLIRHAKVEPEPARVRMLEFGASAHVLEVFAFVRSSDWSEFLGVKEDLNLRIIDIVHGAGTGFAFPSQTLYLGRDHGIDAARGEAVAGEVDHWRQQHRYPFPEFDYAERAEMADTLPFPGEGSPDFRQDPPAGEAPPAAASLRFLRRGPAASRFNSAK